MTETCEVVVIGAGPYGLSIAAHLAAHNIPHRIFGKPMETWATQMPEGMMLKSDGYATGLYDPARSFTFESYCRERKIPFAALGIPPRLEDFVNYGRAFQRILVPHLEDLTVKSLERDGSGYRLRFETGESLLRSRRSCRGGYFTLRSIAESALGIAAGARDTHLRSSQSRSFQRAQGRCNRCWGVCGGRRRTTT